MTTRIEDRRKDLNNRFPSWEPAPLHERFDKLCESFGDDPLVVTENVEWSYGEVRAQSLNLAKGLAQLSVVHGERVAILLTNSPEYFPLKIAISRVGAIAVSLNFLYREPELEYALKQSRTNVLVTMSNFSGDDYLAMLDSICPGWADNRLESLPDLRHVVVIPSGDVIRAGISTLSDLADLGERAGSGVTFPEVLPEDVSDMFYTSGTTGSPKGVLNTHDGLLRSSFTSALTRAMGDGWKTLSSLPLYHTFGYTEGVLAPMWVGGTILPRVKFDAEDYLSGIERFKATEILAVPTMTIAILEAAQNTQYDLSSLISVMSASAATPTWVWEKAKKLLGHPNIVTAWGMTETSASCLSTRPEDPISVHSTTVGSTKISGAAAHFEGELFQVATADPLTGERLPAGSTGELIVSSPSVMVGYWDKPEETAAVLRDGWLYTGDLAQIREDGRVILTGRVKELYKSGGELIMPKEIEDLLMKIPGVRQAFAVGIPDDYWGEVGCAVIIRESGADVTQDEILAVCRSSLAKFKVPKQVLFLNADELPVTPTGKVQKYRLASMVPKTATVD